jgi:transcriptional regulator with GAF, ATPase, and Fis domain
MDVQVKLLRVLQEREFERVGGTETIRVDVRVVAATNRDLTKAIRDGKFREDLYYRLNVFPLALPPLRHRTGDISLLVQFLVAKFSARVGRQINAIAPDTMDRLTSYHWPGNIRELENVLERAIILSNDPVLRIDAEIFGAPAKQSSISEPATAAKHDESPGGSLETIERSHILAVLKQTKWVIEGAKGAAKILDLHPNTLRSRMKKLGIRRGLSEEL